MRFQNNFNEEVSNTRVTRVCSDPEDIMFINDRQDRPSNAISFEKRQISPTCRLELDPTKFKDIQSYTIAVWIKTTKKSYQGELMSIYNQEGGYRPFFKLKDNYLYKGTTKIYTLGITSDYNNITLGKWHHLVYTRNAPEGQIRAYLNLFSLGHFKTEWETGPLTAGYIQIGGNQFSETSSADEYSMSDMRIYNILLDSTQMDMVYRATDKPIYPVPCTEDQLTNYATHINFSDAGTDSCIEKECVEQLPTIQKNVVIPEQALVKEYLSLYYLLDIDPKCFEIKTRLTSNTSGTWDSSQLLVSSIKDCASLCDVDFVITYNGKSEVLVKSTVNISFSAGGDVTELATLSSSTPRSSIFYPNNEPTNPGQASLPKAGIADVVRQTDSNYNTPAPLNGSVEMGTGPYYLYTHNKTGLDKSNFTVELLDPSDDSVIVTLTTDEFNITPDGSDGTIYQIEILKLIVGNFKVSIKA